jgi:hypothetical protein
MRLYFSTTLLFTCCARWYTSQDGVAIIIQYPSIIPLHGGPKDVSTCRQYGCSALLLKQLSKLLGQPGLRFAKQGAKRVKHYLFSVLSRLLSDVHRVQLSHGRPCMKMRTGQAIKRQLLHQPMLVDVGDHRSDRLRLHIIGCR